MVRGVLLLLPLLLVLAVLAWVTAPCGATKMIHTVAMKFKSPELRVCLQVTRGQTTPRPSVRRPASQERHHRRNAKRGLPERRATKELKGIFAEGGLQRQLVTSYDIKENANNSNEYILRRNEKLYSQNDLDSDKLEQHQKTIKEDNMKKKTSLTSPKVGANISTPMLNFSKAINNQSEEYHEDGEGLRPPDTQSPNLSHIKDKVKHNNKFHDAITRKILSPVQFSAESLQDGLDHQNTDASERQNTDHNNPDITRNVNPSRTPASSRRHSLLRPVEVAAERRVVKYKRSPLVEVSLLVTSRSDGVQYLVGAAAVDTRLLADGLHTLHFKHVIDQNQHKLMVEVDGQSCPFTALSVREYGVGLYDRDEVQVKMQGPVSFVASRPCDELAMETGNDTTSTSNRSDGDLQAVQVYLPEERHPIDASISPNLPSLLPKTIVSNVVLRDESLVNVIILNSTIYDSDIKLSFINNSRLFNTTVDTSQVIIANISDSTLLNSSLHNVTLKNCILGNTRTFNSVLFNTTTIYENFPHDHLSPVQTDSSIPPYRTKNVNLEIVSVVDEGKDESSVEAPSGGLNATMMAFGVLGLVALVVVMVGVVAVIARHVSKKRKEMLMVRSAVMGNVKSW